MRKYSLLKYNLNPVFLFLIVLTLLVSCSKSDTAVPANPPHEEFVDYSVNGVAVTINRASGGNMIHATDPLYNDAVYIEAMSGMGSGIHFRFSDQNISATSTQELYHIMGDVMSIPLMPATPIAVRITEYGSIGQFISGSFTGTVHDFITPAKPYLVTCKFRVKRQF
ncbi:MAG TPA: hypothetical protein VK489_15690 [Ferruginibacter sp.]|nr:hypothetical protein [Ferruginibacter sp.]